MIVQAIDSGGALIAFGILVLTCFALTVMGFLFFLLALRGVWRWIIRHTWNDMVVSAERKALDR